MQRVVARFVAADARCLHLNRGVVDAEAMRELAVLLRDDGDLASGMKTQVQSAEQALSAVFQQFVGENSQLFRMLDPSGENKLLTTMQSTIDGVIQAQNASILDQFSTIPNPAPRRAGASVIK